MASIKEIAALAKVSKGTASQVLNGKGDQFRISAATQHRILEAANQLDYRPNISARRLRSGGETVAPIIALFWTTDPRSQLIGRFLDGIQQAIGSLDDEYELMIQPYVGSRLSSVKSLVTGTRFNGAIIALPTEEDERYLEEADIKVPLVLHQRYSSKYCSVNVDSYANGRSVAKLFAEHGHRQASVISPHISSSAIRLRMEGFLEGCRDNGIQVYEKFIKFADISEKGGYQAASDIFDETDAPGALFCLSDGMAVGALHALHERGIPVPERVEVVGYDDDPVSEFSVPSLTTVHLPVNEMAQACVNMLVDLMSRKILAPTAQLFESSMIIRNSSRH